MISGFAINILNNFLSKNKQPTHKIVGRLRGYGLEGVEEFCIWFRSMITNTIHTVRTCCIAYRLCCEQYKPRLIFNSTGIFMRSGRLCAPRRNSIGKREVIEYDLRLCICFFHFNAPFSAEQCGENVLYQPSEEAADKRTHASA